jgi:hypothetical protein
MIQTLKTYYSLPFKNPEYFLGMEIASRLGVHFFFQNNYPTGFKTEITENFSTSALSGGAVKISMW